MNSLEIESDTTNPIEVDIETLNPIEVEMKNNNSENVEIEMKEPGLNGISAYEVALKNGFIGTEEEWLESLKGENGSDGISAYQVAVENGFVGTEEEWLESLKGETGPEGPAPELPIANTDTLGGIIISNNFTTDNNGKMDYKYVCNEPLGIETGNAVPTNTWKDIIINIINICLENNWTWNTPLYVCMNDTINRLVQICTSHNNSLNRTTIELYFEAGIPWHYNGNSTGTVRKIEQYGIDYVEKPLTSTIEAIVSDEEYNNKHITNVINFKYTNIEIKDHWGIGEVYFIKRPSQLVGKDNLEEWTPTKNYGLVHKLYVDNIHDELLNDIINNKYTVMNSINDILYEPNAFLTSYNIISNLEWNFVNVSSGIDIWNYDEATKTFINNNAKQRRNSKTTSGTLTITKGMTNVTITSIIDTEYADKLTIKLNNNIYIVNGVGGQNITKTWTGDLNTGDKIEIIYKKDGSVDSYTDTVKITLSWITTETQVTEVTTQPRVLSTGINYETPYIPEYPGSPVTKQYVDNAVNDINKILEDINNKLLTLTNVSEETEVTK